MSTRNTTNPQILTVGRNKSLYRTELTGKPCMITTCTTINSDLKNQLQQQKNDLKTHQLRKNRFTKLFHDSSIKVNHCKMSVIPARDMHKFYKRPIVPFVAPAAQTLEFPPQFNQDISDYGKLKTEKPRPGFSVKSELHKTRGTQTDYRESEAQTVPWEPPYKVRPGHKPEVLTLAHLTWEHGLPAGKHEIEIINRMRIKRTWEAILPPADTPENLKKRTKILAALEIDEWAFRESEIQFIMELRMKLMEERTEAREIKHNKKVEGRFVRLGERLKKYKEKEVDSIRCNLKRDLRKLKMKHVTWRRAKKRDIITDHTDPRLYASQFQHGMQSPICKGISNKKLLRRSYKVVDELANAEKENTSPNWLPTSEELKALKPKPKSTDLCVRETRWTEEKLKRLHEDLKAIRLKLKDDKKMPCLIKKKHKTPEIPATPLRSDEHEEEDSFARSAMLIQKIVRGRAVQCMMFEGRDRCRELIEELRSTHALEEHSAKEYQNDRENMIQHQREQEDRSLQEERLCEILNSLEGMTVSGMLDHLSKELIRLQDEKRAHAFALLAERERCRREAVEAGRRQLEQNRRREFDEMFRQIVKVNQETVEIYLEDIIKESIEWVAEKEATEYILELWDKVDKEANHAAENATELEQEEMVADMIYNFVLPEVEKRNMRRKLKEKQEGYLRNAHQTIYEAINNLPPVEPSESEVCAHCKKEFLTRTEEEVFSSKTDGVNDTSDLEQDSDCADDKTT